MGGFRNWPFLLLTVNREWLDGLENPLKHAYVIFEWFPRRMYYVITKRGGGQKTQNLDYVIYGWSLAIEVSMTYVLSTRSCMYLFSCNGSVLNFLSKL